MLKEWSVDLSNSAVDLLQRMLRADPLQRLTLEEILAHPWMCHEVEVDHAVSQARSRNKIESTQLCLEITDSYIIDVHSPDVENGETEHWCVREKSGMVQMTQSTVEELSGVAASCFCIRLIQDHVKAEHVQEVHPCECKSALKMIHYEYGGENSARSNSLDLSQEGGTTDMEDDS